MRIVARGWPRGLLVLALVALAVGSYLRLHLLSSQIFLDDEWHGVIKVTGRTLGDVLTRLNPRDNSTLPFNLWNWLLYRFFHWSETTLRLPAIVAGLASLVILPWMARRILGARVAVTFALLLAVSPLLVFYGRFARAYSLTALLTFVVLLLAQRWLTSGRFRDAALTITVGVIAVYAHLSAIAAVVTPLLVGFGLGVVQSLRRSPRSPSPIAVSPRKLLLAGAVLLVLLAPALRAALPGGATLPWATGTPTFGGFLTAMNLISGTTSFALDVVFFSLCAVGIVRLAREQPLLCGILVVAALLSLALVLVMHPEGVDTGLVMLRYMIVVVPIALLSVAVAVHGLAERCLRLLGRTLPVEEVTGAGLAALLVVAGPLPALNRAPNDFTNHSAFQGSYAPPRWDSADARHVYPGFALPSERIPVFYRELASRQDVSAIVEYPFDICNHNNLLYFYQHVHGKRVLAGYCSDPYRIARRALRKDDARPDANLSMMSADEILSRVPADGRIAFRNMVDLARPDALRASGAGVVVLHKAVMGLRTLSDAPPDIVPVFYTSTAGFREAFVQSFGAPIYEDAEIVCFRIVP